MMQMPNPDFIARYTTAGGPASHVEAMELARAGMAVLAAALPASDRHMLTAILPAGLSEVCRCPYSGPDLTLDQTVERFAEAADLEDSDALEQLQILCSIVAERLSPDTRTVLRGRLPDALAPLLRPPERSSRPPAQPSHKRGSTAPSERNLAGAHASERSVAETHGSGHTLADGTPDRAQAGSVANWDEARTSRTLGGYTGPKDQ